MTKSSQKATEPRHRGRLIRNTGSVSQGSAREDDEPLTKAELRHIREIARDLDDPIRYMVVSEFGRNFILYYNVSSDTFVMNEPAGGTVFKRLKAAQAVRRLLGHGLRIVTYTTKGGRLNRLSRYRGRSGRGRK